MKILAYPILILAGLGFVTSVFVHIDAWLNEPIPVHSFIGPLVLCLFIVWLSAILFANSLSRDFKQRDNWRAVMRGCPIWLQRLAQAVFIYAFLNFVLVARIGSNGTPAMETRLLSGHLMAFYIIAFCISYSWIQTRQQDTAKRCPNGHPTSGSARYCEQCGAQIAG
jgi:hypothetical protein